jgi:MFS transporter, DHA2 family, multidrug resistance protein
VSSFYAGHIADASATAGLDVAAASRAESSLGAAQEVAGTLGEGASAFVSAANQAFVDALSVGLRISAAIVFATGVMAWRFLPARAARPGAAPETPETPAPPQPAVPAGDASMASAGD